MPSLNLDRKIGIVTWDYMNAKGGLGRSVQWIANALRAGGISVTVAAPRVDDANDVSLLPGTQSLPVGHLLFSLLLPFRIQSFLRCARCHILLLPSGPGGVFLWKRPRGVKIIVLAYHTYAQQARLVPGQWWKGIFVPLECRTYRMADRVLCFCEETARVLRDNYGLNPNRIHVLPHAVDIEAWRGGEDKKEEGLCVCVARLERRKGVEVLLRAWSQIIARIPNARLVIVGRGYEKKKIDRLMQKAGGSVIRKESLLQEELRSLVACASVVVCPSHLEGFGLSAAEAMAAGTAIVASDCDGLRSLIRNNETGLLVTPGDPKALADGILRLLSDPKLRHRLAAAAQEEAKKRFDPMKANIELLTCCILFPCVSALSAPRSLS